jgi:hypothetical protein
MLTEHIFVQKALEAIQQQDYQVMEGLRDHVNAANAEALVRTWNSSLPWRLKDGYVTVLMDQKGEVVKPLMQDALNSPTPESRAYALCSLTGDFGIFDSLLTSDMVDEKKVDEAIKQYKARHPLQ